jgi:hypothetical protein
VCLCGVPQHSLQIDGEQYDISARFAKATPDNTSTPPLGGPGSWYSYRLRCEKQTGVAKYWGNMGYEVLVVSDGDWVAVLPACPLTEHPFLKRGRSFSRFYRSDAEAADLFAWELHLDSDTFLRDIVARAEFSSKRGEQAADTLDELKAACGAKS